MLTSGRIEGTVGTVGWQIFTQFSALDSNPRDTAYFNHIFRKTKGVARLLATPLEQSNTVLWTFTTFHTYLLRADIKSYST